MASIKIPDRSNGPKSIEQPYGHHCHCALVITGIGVLKKGKYVEMTTNHTHPGKGGWWKNNDCDICKDLIPKKLAKRKTAS